MFSGNHSQAFGAYYENKDMYMELEAARTREKEDRLEEVLLHETGHASFQYLQDVRPYLYPLLMARQ